MNFFVCFFNVMEERRLPYFEKLNSMSLKKTRFIKKKFIKKTNNKNKRYLLSLSELWSVSHAWHADKICQICRFTYFLFLPRVVASLVITTLMIMATVV